MKKISPYIPDPNSGWSREVVSLEKAIVVPDPTRGNSKLAGVLHEGVDFPKAALFRGSVRFFRAPPTPGSSIKRLPGRHLWGGFLFHHFGHFLCESVSRLWAAQAVNFESIVFAPRTTDIKVLAKYQQQFIELLGVERQIQLIQEPSEIEELIVPGQGFGLGRIARGTPEFRAMAARLAERIEPAGAERIYISRAGVGGSGGILHESIIERNMAEAGYTIYHPQKHPLEAQLAQFKAATHIVGLDSSAFHLAGYVAHPSQRYCIVLRRNMTAFYNIVRQLEGFTGVRPDVVNVLKGDWMRPNKRKPNRLSVGEIDHAALGDRLLALGYIGSAGEWIGPTKDQYAAAVQGIRKKMGPDAVFRPVEKPAESLVFGLF